MDDMSLDDSIKLRDASSLEPVPLSGHSWGLNFEIFDDVGKFVGKQHYVFECRDGLDIFLAHLNGQIH
jgi:hypothetical protein